jgi:hypothetical protein
MTRGRPHVNEVIQLLQDERIFYMGTSPDMEEVLDKLDVDEEQKEFFRRAAKREPLDPELESWVEQDTPLGPFVKHPLVYMGVGDDGQMNATANHVLRQKQKSLEKAIEEENWFVIIHVLYERPYRLHAFQTIEDKLTDEEYWSLLGSIWTDSENIYQNEEEWQSYLHSERPRSECMMEEDERKAFAELPSELTVWRGFCKAGREFGFSWTIDPKKAAWFSRRLAIEDRGDVPRVAYGTCEKEHALAYFTGRGESEILIAPENIRNMEILSPEQVEAMPGD